MLDRKKPLYVRHGKRVRCIPAGKWFVDRNTPVGEDADVYETKPFGGRKWIPWGKIVGHDAEAARSATP